MKKGKIRACTTNTPPRAPMSSQTSARLKLTPRFLFWYPHLTGPAAFRQFSGCRHAIGVNSGTAGTVLLVRAAGNGPGDLAITTPFSFVASTNVFLFEQAVPVFVDAADPLTGNIDPVLVEQVAADLKTGGAGLPRKGVGEGRKGESAACGGCIWTAGGAGCTGKNRAEISGT